jgi:hypothetical protein
MAHGGNPPRADPASGKTIITASKITGKMTTCGQPYFVSGILIIKYDNLQPADNQDHWRLFPCFSNEVNKKKADLRGIGLSEEGDDTRFYPAPKAPLPSATANKGTLTPPFCIAAMKQRCHFDTGGELFLCI